jgi:hypothetical protein
MTKQKQKLGKYQKMWLNGLKGKLKKKYKQGKGYLCQSDSSRHKYYCCLGVACDIFKDKVDGEWVKFTNGVSDFVEGNSSFEGELPNSIQDLLKFRYSDGAVEDSIKLMKLLDDSVNVSSLAQLNDDPSTKGFSKIIKAIEADPSLFFTGPA